MPSPDSVHSRMSMNCFLMKSISAMAGDLQFQDTDGNGVLNDDDKVVIGNPYPKFAYGFTAGLGYKQFDMSLLFNGVMGVDIYNGKWW